jgi:hypothetical protein
LGLTDIPGYLKNMWLQYKIGYVYRGTRHKFLGGLNGQDRGIKKVRYISLSG